MDKSIALRYGLTAIVIAGAIYTIAETFDIDAAFETAARADPWSLVFAVASFYITFPLRTARWRRFLDSLDINTDRFSANLILLVGYYLNVIVPAKLGDLYRSYLAAKRYDSPISSVGGTIVAERIIDLVLLAVGLIALLPIVLSHRIAFVSRIVIWTGGLLAVLAVGGTVMFVSDFVPLPQRLLSLFNRFRQGLRAATRGSALDRAWILTLSMCIWGANVVRTALVAGALDIHLQLAEITLLALLVAFLSGLPYLPSGIGVVEVIGSSVLVSLGLTPGSALALILLDRFITVVTLLLVGTPVYLFVKHAENIGSVRSAV
jgi:uncharacterized membrane protein YbhN (UPF0104 family)